MPLKLGDRVRETSATQGTGTLTLNGAVQAYQTFDSVLDTGDTCYYTIVLDAAWEVGLGTFTAPNLLARTTVLASSNGGALVNFGAGAKDVFITLPAGVSQRIARAEFLRGYLGGLTLSRLSTTTVGIAAGACASSDNTTLMSLGSAVTKSTGAWAAGSGNGGLDTGTVASNTWYHVFVIERPDTQLVDVLFSASATAPSLPSNYTNFRRIGAVRTNGSAQLIDFVQEGDNFRWLADVTDLAGGSWSTTAALTTLTVPTGVKVEAFGYASASSSAGNAYFRLDDPASTDTAAGGAGSVGFLIAQFSNFVGVSQFRVTTNTSAQVRRRSSDASGTGYITTLGWVDTRGRFA
jgi:hypothetical protein